MFLLLAGCTDHHGGHPQPPDPCDDPRDGILCTVAGTGQPGSNGDDLPALESRLFVPMFGTIDAQGRFLFADYNNERIRRIDGDQLVTVAGNGGHAYATDGAQALDTPLENPVSVVGAPDGTMFIYEQHGARILKVDPSGRLAVYAGSADYPGYSLYFGDGGPALGAGMSQGNDLALAPDGTLYFADTCNNAVRVISPDGIIDTVIASGPPPTGATYAYCTPADGPVSFPWGLALDGDVLYVSEASSNAIDRVDLETGERTPIAGGFPNPAPGDDLGDGGPAVDAHLFGPAGLSVGPDGALYVADSYDDAIRRIDPNGTISTVVGRLGVDGGDGDGGPPEDALLWVPNDVEVTADGDLYVVDTHNARIREVRGFVP